MHEHVAFQGPRVGILLRALNTLDPNNVKLKKKQNPAFLRLLRQIELSFEVSWLSWALLHFNWHSYFSLWMRVFLIVSRCFEDFESRDDNQLFSTWISLERFIVAFSFFKIHHLSPKVLIFWSESLQFSFEYSCHLFCRFPTIRCFL